MTLFASFIWAIFSFYPFFVSSELRIDITKGNLDPIPIAILKLNSNEQEETDLSTNINNVIKNNLSRSGLFSVLPNKIFLNNKISFNKKPEFADWKLTTAQGLVHGKLRLDGNKLSIEFRLWDVFSQKQMIAQQLVTEKNN